MQFQLSEWWTLQGSQLAKVAWTMTLTISIAAYGTAVTWVSTYKAAIAEMSLQTTFAAKPLKRICPVTDWTSAVHPYCSNAGLQGALHATKCVGLRGMVYEWCGGGLYVKYSKLVFFRR